MSREATTATTDNDAETQLLARLRRIRLIVFDFDGVFTDNTVFVFEDGREAVRCWRSDGLGLGKLRQIDVEALVLSTETNRVVAARARKLGLRCMQGCTDKQAALEEIAVARGLHRDEVAYVGNDINDLGCLSFAGLPIVVGDAHPAVVDAACYRTSRPGGRGAVREVCDLVVYAHEESRDNARS